jgi:hypothetical protein
MNPPTYDDSAQKGILPAISLSCFLTEISIEPNKYRKATLYLLNPCIPVAYNQLSQ